ncbi:MAG: helix-turn-helix domain-containing protein [Oscillospiraceae bacterium]|nr:helix-turn-helix domain-containing protein [Oscillospiraceae bacterium]
MSDFGELLKKLRQGANLTQKQLGDRIFVSETMVSYYEHSRRPPSADVLMQIAEVFHVSVDYLLGREKKEQTLNLRGLSDKDMEFLQIVVLYLQEKNDEQDRKKKEEQDQKKNEEQDNDTTANF